VMHAYHIEQERAELWSKKSTWYPLMILLGRQNFQNIVERLLLSGSMICRRNPPGEFTMQFLTA